MSKIFLLTVAIFLGGCATPYGEYGMLGGYKDARIDENTFSVSVVANGFTSQQTASSHALYRAAELTLDNGFDYFVIVSIEQHSQSTALVMPGSTSSFTTLYGAGFSMYAQTNAYTTPSTIVPIAFPNASLTIKTFKGDAPRNTLNTYDAHSVLKHLGVSIKKQTR